MCSFWGRLIRSSRAGEHKLNCFVPCSRVLGGLHVCAPPAAVLTSTHTCLWRAFPRAKSLFGARGVLIQFIVGLRRESSNKASAAAAAAAAAVLSKRSSIPSTHCCHRMTIRAAGGRRKGCATMTRWEQECSCSSSGGSSQASIVAVVGCCVVWSCALWGGERCSE